MAEPWKNAITPQSVAELGAAVRAGHARFDAAALQARVIDELWHGRGLMDRLRHISAVLRDLLPADYAAALDILREAAPRLDGHSLQNLVFPEFVGAYGLADWDASMPAIEQFTQQTTCEFAVRPFIVSDQPRMLAQMLAWSRHESHHVRRLASEGSRPRLPWGIALRALQEDPRPLVPILEALKDDEAEYVRRSVANNLNEIAKDHPDFAIGLLRSWQEGASTETRWIIRHALRTLVKRGHAGALDLLGFAADPQIEVRGLRAEPDPVAWGGRVTITFEVLSTCDQKQNLMIDFVMYLMRARGRQTPKVFKLTQKSIEPGGVIQVEKAFSFRPGSSRRYYAGEHAVAPKINGREYDRIGFTLAKEGGG